MNVPTETGPAIYMIRNRLNGRRYIGSTARPIERAKSHRYYLRSGTHRNKALQADWSQHGPDAFEFVVLRRLRRETSLSASEQRQIDRVVRTGTYALYNCYPKAGRSRAVCRPRMPQINVSIDEASLRRLNELAREEDISRSFMGAKLIKEALDARRKGAE